MATVSRLLREQVTQRAKGRCEYCQTPQPIVIEMELDHIIPESAGGQTTAENLCLACASCNSFKGAFQTGFDPHTQQELPLYNPRHQRWDEHFQWAVDGAHLIGLTAIGRATINRLHINRELAVQARERWVKAGWHPPTD